MRRTGRGVEKEKRREKIGGRERKRDGDRERKRKKKGHREREKSEGDRRREKKNGREGGEVWRNWCFSCLVRHLEENIFVSEPQFLVIIVLFLQSVTNK